MHIWRFLGGQLKTHPVQLLVIFLDPPVSRPLTDATQAFNLSANEGQLFAETPESKIWPLTTMEWKKVDVQYKIIGWYIWPIPRTSSSHSFSQGYTGCLIWLVLLQKVLSMELVPPNRKKWLSSLEMAKIPTKKVKVHVRVCQTFTFCCKLAGSDLDFHFLVGFLPSPVNLVIFSYWGGPVPYLELFGVGPVKWNTLYKSYNKPIWTGTDHESYSDLWKPTFTAMVDVLHL